MKILSIVGARPNFMKVAAIARAIEQFNQDSGNQTEADRIDHYIVHTGQHYDEAMSKQFFHDLRIPEPDINLEVGSGSHAIQTSEIIKRFEPVLLDYKPDVLIIVGDVNSTIACALVAVKISYPTQYNTNRPVIAHVEAGLRSFDNAMPEEVNRILSDTISDMLFVTEKSGMQNLQTEGVHPDKIHFVGNVMIDTLYTHLNMAKSSTIKEVLNIQGKYCLTTLHRPSNVDRKEDLLPLIECLEKISEKCQIVFPLHPRTRNNMEKFNILQRVILNKNIILCPPLSYLDFIHLTMHATMVLTDSGGIQEETTILSIPCLTLRHNTERPVTVDIGTNYLLGTDVLKIYETVESVLNGNDKKSEIPELWDGKAGQRIISKIVEHCQSALITGEAVL